MQFASVAFVSELPTIDSQGGVVTCTYVSGEMRRSCALPLWLARLVHKRLGEVIANEDELKQAA